MARLFCELNYFARESNPQPSYFRLSIPVALVNEPCSQLDLLEVKRFPTLIKEPMLKTKKQVTRCLKTLIQVRKCFFSSKQFFLLLSRPEPELTFAVSKKVFKSCRHFFPELFSETFLCRKVSLYSMLLLLRLENYR